MKRKLKVLLPIAIAVILVLSLVFAPTALAKPRVTPQPPLVTQTIPITMMYDAGWPYTPTWWTASKVMHGGIGWVAPFGRSSYIATPNYSGAAALKPAFMGYTSFKNIFGSMGLFCVYRLADGDIYAFDGIMGGLEPVVSDDGKADYLVNIIVGGTGRYEGATGMVVGRTPGRGHQSGASPEALMKLMSGYINIQVPSTRYSTALPTIPISNAEVNPLAWTMLVSGRSDPPYTSSFKLVPIVMEMEAGFRFYQPSPDFGGLTIHSGVGWVEPFGRFNYWAGMYPSASAYRPDFMDDASWTSMFGGTNLFCVYKSVSRPADWFIAWDGIMGNIQPVVADDGKMDCLINVIVGGHGAFAKATGVMIGYTPGRGYTQTTSSGIGLPLSILKLMQGYVIQGNGYTVADSD